MVVLTMRVCMRCREPYNGERRAVREVRDGVAVLGCLTQDAARYVCMYMRLDATALPKALEVVNVHFKT